MMTSHSEKVFEWKKKFAKLFISTTEDENIDFQRFKVDLWPKDKKVPSLPFTVLLSEFAPLCLADERSFPFLDVMLKAIFDSNSGVKMNKELQNKMTDLFMKLADTSFNPTALKSLFDKYRNVLIQDDGPCASAEDIAKDHYEYLTWLVEFGRDKLDSNFVVEYPKLSGPIMRDLEEILDMSSSDSNLTDTFIKWLPYKHKLPFIFHCTLFAIKLKIWNHNCSETHIEQLFNTSRKLMEVCYWPIADEARIVSNSEYLKLKHELELISVFIDALLFDIAANPFGSHVRDQELNYPIVVNMPYSTACLITFVSSLVAEVFDKLLGKRSDYLNKIRELSSRTGSEKFVQEQIAVSAISFSCSYFDLADQVFNTPLNVDLSEEAGLSKPIKNCIDILNKWQTAFVTAQLYLAEINEDSVGRRKDEETVFDELVEGLNESLAFKNDNMAGHFNVKRKQRIQAEPVKSKEPEVDPFVKKKLDTFLRTRGLQSTRGRSGMSLIKHMAERELAASKEKDREDNEYSSS